MELLTSGLESQEDVPKIREHRQGPQGNPHLPRFAPQCVSYSEFCDSEKSKQHPTCTSLGATKLRARHGNQDAPRFFTLFACVQTQSHRNAPPFMSPSQHWR